MFDFALHECVRRNIWTGFDSHPRFFFFSPPDITAYYCGEKLLFDWFWFPVPFTCGLADKISQIPSQAIRCRQLKTYKKKEFEAPRLEDVISIQPHCWVSILFVWLLDLRGRVWVFMIISARSGLAASMSVFKCCSGNQDHSKLLEHAG